MKKYAEMTLSERQAEYAAVKAAYEQQKALGLKLNMARGKPGRDQLDMVTDIFNVLIKPEDFIDEGIETRNYGEVAGIPSAKALFADILGCKPEQVFVGGNASLQLMYDAVSKAFTHGLLHSEKPWCKLDKVKWICPVPGYDRHFKVTQSFGVEMINVPMTADGPDMDKVEELVKDPAVKGMWNVPKYSNPEGVVYSAETIRRLAAMKPAAPDFMLMWDNAYCIHEFDCDYVDFPDILSLCAENGNADMVYEFASTSKVTFPGAGVGVMASSEDNIAYFTKLINIQTIGFDKINQLRHVRYLKDKTHTLALMKKHAAILAPKFHAVLDALDDCVLYQVKGPYRSEATGLSCYYSYNGDVDDLAGYAGIGAGEAFKYFYEYELTGQLTEDGTAYLAGLDIDASALQPVQGLSDTNWDNAPLTLSDDGCAVLTLGPEADALLASVGFSLYYADEESDILLMLGIDNDIIADWDNGVFTDNFRGVWGAIDGHMVYMELSYEGDDYNLYAVPVLLDGEAYYLQVVYDFTEEAWSILGARQGIDDSGMASKELRLLQEGDELTTVWYVSSISGDDDFAPYEIDTFTVTADTSFDEVELPDGQYFMMFELRDVMDNCAYSDVAVFTCEGGEITTTVG